MITSLKRGTPLRVVVVFDTAGFLRSLPLTGAAARTLHLNRHLHALGCPTTVLLCDLNPRSHPSGTWPLPVRYLPYDALYERTGPLFAQVLELAPAVLVMSNTQLVVRYGRALAEASGARLVYEMHDDDAALLRSIGAEHRQAALLQAAAITAADGVVAFTGRDATRARALGARSVHVVPCGAEPGPRPPHQHHRSGGVAFVGNLYYEPNLRAVRYLHHTLAPLLAPGTVIDVFGRYPRDARGLADRVRLRGPVADLRAVLVTEWVGVAPLDCGGGMKLKVLDYLAAGLPVVGTPEAFVGFAAPERFALVSATATMTDLPSLVAELLADQRLCRRLGHTGRRLVERCYSWRAMAQLAREAYAAIGDSHSHPGVARTAQLVELAGQAPYWLREWRGRGHPDQEGTTVADDTGGQRWATSVVGALAEAIDCARLAAESALDTVFADRAIVGYGGRSMVFLAPQTVLKVYTHQPSERLRREITGLTLAARAPGLRVPAVLGHDDIPGSLAWMSATRLAGTQASDPAWQDLGTTELLGRAAARLHSLPTGALSDPPEFTRRIRELPTGDTGAYQAGTALAEALAGVEGEHRPRCARGFVHGDFSARNVLLAPDQPPGVIDFEGCGVGCRYEDLATLVMQDGLLGDRDIRGLLAGYTVERARLGHVDPEVDRRHLLFHLAWRARWILQWAVEIDPPLACQVTALTPHLLTNLTGQQKADPMAPDREELW